MTLHYNPQTLRERHAAGSLCCLRFRSYKHSLSGVLKQQFIKQTRVKTREEQTTGGEWILNSLPQNACWAEEDVVSGRSYKQELHKRTGSYFILGEAHQGIFAHTYTRYLQQCKNIPNTTIIKIVEHHFQIKNTANEIIVLRNYIKCITLGALAYIIFSGKN